MWLVDGGVCLSARFPVINNLAKKINLKKRKDSLVLGAVVSACVILTLLYVF